VSRCETRVRRAFSCYCKNGLRHNCIGRLWVQEQLSLTTPWYVLLEILFLKKLAIFENVQKCSVLIQTYVTILICTILQAASVKPAWASSWFGLDWISFAQKMWFWLIFPIVAILLIMMKLTQNTTAKGTRTNQTKVKWTEQRVYTCIPPLTFYSNVYKKRERFRMDIAISLIASHDFQGSQSK